MNNLVSVLIVTYNRPKLLIRAINSVLSQTYENIELIIVDDASHTKNKLPNDNRLKYFKNKINKGAQFCRNKGLEIAKGELFLNLDDDDFFHYNRIEILVNYFNKNNYSFICSNYIYFNKTLNSSSINKYCKKIITIDDILFENFAGPSIITKTMYLRELGGWDLNLNSAQDHDMWIRLILEKGPAYRISEFLLTVDQNLNRFRLSNNQKVLMGYYLVYLKYKNIMNISQKKYRLLKFRRLKGKRNSIVSILKYTPRNLIIYELKNFFKFFNKLN